MKSISLEWKPSIDGDVPRKAWRKQNDYSERRSKSIRNWHELTSGWSGSNVYLIDLGLAPSVEEALSKIMEAAEKAVQLDPNDGETHLALGQAYAYHGKREQALAEFAKAETLAPSNADLLLIIAWVSSSLVNRNGQ